MTQPISHRIAALLVLVALPAAWVPAHMACTHHAMEGETAQAPARAHCGGMAAGNDAPGWTMTRCCTDGLDGLCCAGRESSPVVSLPTVDTPQAREADCSPTTMSPAPVVPVRASGETIPGSGDLPPPDLHRYRDLSVLRL